MEQIYLIEDINELKYVGRTKKTLNQRLSDHKYDKKRKNCSSAKLDLDKCTITCIDIADSPQEARELEEFYINSIDCVNHLRYNFDKKQHMKEYYQKNKEYQREYQKEYRDKNKDKKNKDKKYYQKNKDEINRKRRESYQKKKLMNTSES